MEESSKDDNKEMCSSKKRQRGDQSPSSIFPQQLKVDSDEYLKSNADPTSTMSRKKSNTGSIINDSYNITGERKMRLRLEAIFHPKFENESSTRTIRQAMLNLVSSQAGYLEASLKHSGSLLLWSGASRFYSKNSTDNMFTKVGEWMVLQHFQRAWVNPGDGDGNDHVRWEEKYRECCEYLETHRLTLSFEVVTSILGHHGDIPKRDYLILLAVADRSRSTSQFYNTEQLTELAQKFRLPHNDIWVFNSMQSCQRLFDIYDSSREEGTAGSIIPALDSAVGIGIDGDETGKADRDGSKIFSMNPHDVFQGDILEGIVIRYVPYDTKSIGRDGPLDGALEKINKLSQVSRDILKLVAPSNTKESNKGVDNTTKNTHLNLMEIDSRPNEFDFVGQVDLRTIANHSDFENQLDTLLLRFHGANKRVIMRLDELYSKHDGFKSDYDGEQFDIIQIASNILSSSDVDIESRQIAKLIETLHQLNVSVSYKVVAEETNNVDTSSISKEAKKQLRFICIVHVHNDSSFQKYHEVIQKKKNPCKSDDEDNDIALFRGFSFEIRVGEGHGRNLNIIQQSRLGNDGIDRKETITLTTDSADPAIEKLMLKMKFLPYMVRTFICRNGLSILQKSGSSAFEQYALNQFVKWEMSEGSREKWFPFFRGWALYCQSLSSTNSSGTKLPPLTSGTYLHHYNEFSKLYASGQFQSATNDKSFRGLIVVVGPSKRRLENLAHVISNELKCSKLVSDINSVSENDMLLSMQRQGGGMVCVAGIEDGVKNLRKLAKANKSALYIVMIGCLDEELESACIELEMDNKTLRKVKGISKAWRKTSCNMLLDLPPRASYFDRSEVLTFIQTDADAKNVLSRLEESSRSYRTDDRPGLVVFFPSIPGSGKSSLCCEITAESLGIGNNRKLILREGDQVKQKFYNVVEKEILNEPACVAILDKNVPPVSWPSISNLCARSRSLAAAVLPIGMKDTIVGKKGASNVYPFSLHYLAICMSRVLNRVSNSHKGKLDSGTVNACMIVVKFYCLYRNITAAKMKDRFSTMGVSKYVQIEVPFFAGESEPDLPDDLKAALQDAIEVQTREDLKIETSGENDALKVNIENTLRSCIQKHHSFLDNLTIGLNESREVFRSQLLKTIDTLGDENLDIRMNQGEINSKRIKIVSLDFDQKDIQAMLEELSKANPPLKEYFAKREEDRVYDERNKKQNRFITSLHCTFAHKSHASQEEMLRSFNHLLGIPVIVNATAILFSQSIAAIELEIPDKASNNPPSAIPRPENKFAHITLWCAKNTPAFRSNDLPRDVKLGFAERISFEVPVTLRGVFSFWH